MQRLTFLVLVVLLAAVSDRAWALSSFTPSAIGPEGGWITALSLSPTFATDGRVWAAAFGGRIYASADGAHSWSAAHAGETDPVVEGLATSPSFTTDRTVFAATDEGVFRSADAGSTWQLSSAGLGNHYVRAIVVSPSYAVDRQMWVATDAGVYRSTDGGSSWNPPSNSAQPIVSLALMASGTLIAGLDSGGLVQSLDGGAHWQAVSAFELSLRALCIQSTHMDGSAIVVGTDNGIWRTSDGGTSWVQVAAPGDRIDAVAAASEPASSPRLFAGSGAGHGVFASSDGGATWNQVGAPEVPFVTALAVADGSTVIAGTAGGGISVSSDGGLHWRSANHNLLAMSATSLRVTGSTLMVGGNGGAFARDLQSTNWQAYALPSHFVTSLDGRGADRYVGTQDTGLLVSHDSGASWLRSSVPSSAVGQVAVSPLTSRGYDVVAAGDYVYRSADRGASFQKAQGLAGNDVRSFAFSPGFALDATLFAGTISHGAYKSVDSGMTWTAASVGLPAAPIMQVLPSPRFAMDHTVYAATAGNGVFLSTSGGDSWSAVVPSVPDGVVDALAWTAEGDLVAGTEHGIYERDASGWTRLGSGWDGYVASLQDVAPAEGETLYAGTTGEGVWELPLRGAATSSASPTAPTAAITAVTPTPVKPLPPVPTARPTPRPRAWGLKAAVVPVPADARQPALLSIRGPAGGKVVVRLNSRGWQRQFTGTLARDGSAAFGFVAPTSDVSVVAKVTLSGRVGQVALLVRVSGD